MQEITIKLNQEARASTLEKVSEKYSRIIRAMHCGELETESYDLRASKMKKLPCLGLNPNLLCHEDDDSVSDYFNGSFQTGRMIKGHGILWLLSHCPLSHSFVHEYISVTHLW